MLNEILGVAARFNQLLTRKFNIVGGAPAPQLTPEIGCELALEVGSEGRVLLSEILCSGITDQTGAAANRPAAMLFNPVGSNIILVVERIAVLPLTVAQAFVIGVIKPPGGNPFAQLPGSGQVICRETRVPVAPPGTFPRAPTGQVRGSTVSPPTTVSANLYSFSASAANISSPLEVPQLGNGESLAILAPGFAVQIESTVLVAQFQAFFMWREVPLAPGEIGPF